MFNIFEKDFEEKRLLFLKRQLKYCKNNSRLHIFFELNFLIYKFIRYLTNIVLYFDAQIKN